MNNDTIVGWSIRTEDGFGEIFFQSDLTQETIKKYLNSIGIGKGEVMVYCNPYRFSEDNGEQYIDEDLTQLFLVEL